MSRQDLMVLGFSIIFLGGILGGMYGWGIAKGWDSNNPIFDHDSERFWPKVLIRIISYIIYSIDIF